LNRIDSYAFETVREDGKLVLHRGRRKEDGSRLLAVEPVSERPSVLDNATTSLSFSPGSQCSWVQQRRFKAGGNILSYLERASDLAQFGLSEACRSAFSLQPTIIEESGLIEALQKLLERSNIPGRLRGNFHSSGVPEESLPSSVQQELLRIAQQAMSSAVRHAKPTVISVNLRGNPSDLGS
jgi:hypothetical protein